MIILTGPCGRHTVIMECAGHSVPAGVTERNRRARNMCDSRRARQPNDRPDCFPGRVVSAVGSRHARGWSAWRCGCHRPPWALGQRAVSARCDSAVRLLCAGLQCADAACPSWCVSRGTSPRPLTRWVEQRTEGYRVACGDILWNQPPRVPLVSEPAEVPGECGAQYVARHVDRAWELGYAAAWRWARRG